MLANFEAGGAAVCVLARRAGAELRVFDLGVGTPTGDIAEGPAMSRERADECLARGDAVAAELAAEGFGIVALGEMGIGNTTSASALVAALLGVEPAAVVGRGTGVDDAGLARKVAVVALALDANRTDDPLGTLAALGGFEIAFLSGVAVGAAKRGVVVLLDGFITGSAALSRSGFPLVLVTRWSQPTSRPSQATASCSRPSGWSRCSTLGCGWVKGAARHSRCRSCRRRWRSSTRWRRSSRLESAIAARALAAAVAFLTCIPVGRRVVLGAEDVARAAPFFPVVGAGIGALGGLVAAGLEGPLPPFVAAGIALAVVVALTGALHVDALADTADAIGAGRARALEVMRDSRIGAFGAVAVALAVLVEAGAVGGLVSGGDAVVAWTAAGALSRGLSPRSHACCPTRGRRAVRGACSPAASPRSGPRRQRPWPSPRRSGCSAGTARSRRASWRRSRSSGGSAFACGSAG